ncbi:AbrB/MazE/SpoVT family DNA-binding domain-containing protein [Brucella haematophila]|uniref:AbrB/MazE/SpoVT family DNA-binding domain-containing protein n=1 Tax=Brucella haematophila TaxID=419474 RepID=A0ABX1DJI8_9HYPH|nr:AbrB/MazE/SpoVT family DNA-binding domain-containing protein [Brucella haematophila]NKC03096.1 AbrB/MazE/SpoVT family DNA-binding domain-containing protein [Brucella haematophila]TMU95634.1 AbrB/MazE/SpoVT family DNA-binding domain-containing protein [Brucella haematophila]
MYVTLRKIGNSEGVILPKEVLKRLNLRAGDKLQLAETQSGLSLEPIDDSFEQQVEAARKVMDKYKVTLQKLAE